MEEEKKKKEKIIMPIIWGVLILMIIIVLVISNSKKNTDKNVAVNTDKVVQIETKEKEEEKKPAEKKEIVLSKNSVILSVGGSETLTLTNDTNKKLTWSSTHPSIASVDSSGRVTAVSMGTAIITGQTEDGSEGNCTIIVKDGKVVTKKPTSSNNQVTKPSNNNNNNNTNNNNTYKPSTPNNNNNQNEPTYPNEPVNPDEPIIDPNEPVNPDEPIIDPDDPTEVVKCLVTFMVDGKLYTTKEVEEGQVLGTLPDSPKKYGYTFRGWYDGDIAIDSETVITEEVTIEAKWDTYTFELALINDDSISPNRIVKAYKNGQSVNIKELYGTIGDNTTYKLATWNERLNEVKCVSAKQVERATDYMIVLNNEAIPVYANEK